MFPSGDEFVNWKTASTALTTGVAFPLAAQITQLRDFFYDAPTQRIFSTFATIFSAAVVLYCHSQGVDLVGGLSWAWGFFLGAFFFVGYYVLLLYFRQNLPANRHYRVVLLLAGLFLYCGLFVSLSYGFNKLTLLKLSKFSVSGCVYGVKRGKASASPLKGHHVVVSLERPGGFLVARRLTDPEGNFTFSLSLDELSLVTSIKAFDPSEQYHEASENIPGSALGSIIRDIFLFEVDP